MRRHAVAAWLYLDLLHQLPERGTQARGKLDVIEGINSDIGHPFHAM
jgi:hypothetical protein